MPTNDKDQLGCMRTSYGRQPPQPLPADPGAAAVGHRELVVGAIRPKGAGEAEDLQLAAERHGLACPRDA